MWLVRDWLSPLPAHTTDAFRELHRRNGLSLAVMVAVQSAAVGAALVPRKSWWRFIVLLVLVPLGTAAVIGAIGGRERVVTIFTDPLRLFPGVLGPPIALFLVHDLALRRHVGAAHSLRVPDAYLLLGVIAGVAIGSAGGRRGMVIGVGVATTLLMLQYYSLLAAMALAGRRKPPARQDEAQQAT
jgi:hypothetical protein